MDFNVLDDDRQFPGTLQEYFGDDGYPWEQFSLTEGTSGVVTVSITCSDTNFPSQQPSEQPSEQPTEEPTEQPSEDPSEEPSEQPTEAPTGVFIFSDMRIGRRAQVWGLWSTEARWVEK